MWKGKLKLLADLDFDEGIHRSADPVSKSTTKGCPGVPIVIGP